MTDIKNYSLNNLANLYLSQVIWEEAVIEIKNIIK